MIPAVVILDLDNMATAVAECVAELGLPETLPPDAELLLELNWATSAPGVDWPESYFISRDVSGDHWVLWAHNKDDPLLVEREVYPVCYCDSAYEKVVAAQALLKGIWGEMRDRYDQHRFELVERYGIVGSPAVDTAADAVWGEGPLIRPVELGGPQKGGRPPWPPSSVEAVHRGDHEMSGSDAGLRTVEDIYANLKIDQEWSTREGLGFTWWAHRHAQRVWAEDLVDQDGVRTSVAHVETDVMRGLSALAEEEAFGHQIALSIFGGTSSLTAVLVDREFVRFHSTVIAHDENQAWVSRLIQMAAVVQIVNAELFTGELASRLGVELDETGHPQRGFRSDSESDEMLHALEDLPLRDRPWGEQAEFEEVAAFLTDRGVLSSPGELGLTAEFPYGPHGGFAATRGTSHLLQAESTEHGAMGLGLRMTLRLREWPMDGERQIFPPELNLLEATQGSGAHLLGSWATENDPSAVPFFTCFVPSGLYAPGSLVNLVLSMGVRARWVSERIPDAAM